MARGPRRESRIHERFEFAYVARVRHATGPAARHVRRGELRRAKLPADRLDDGTRRGRDDAPRLPSDVPMNYDDERRVAQIAARVTSEQIRNLVRGTGGQIVPTLSMRTATRTTIGAPGDQVMLRVDGDSIDDLAPNDPTSTNLVPAINASGAILGDGDRVMVTWVPPHGVYVTQQLRNGIAGDWTPVLLGPSAANGAATGVGH